MNNIYYWLGVIACAMSLKGFFVMSGTDSFNFPTNTIFCVIYSFSGGFLVFRWSVICKWKQTVQHQKMSFLFPFVGVIIAILSGFIWGGLIS